MRSSTKFSQRSRVKTLVGMALACLSVVAVPAGAGELSPATASLRVDLLLPDLDGHDRRLDEFRGKVVLVNFWASWCTPCIDEMPSLQRLVELMRDKPFAVLGVNVNEGELRVKTMVQRLGIGFPVLLDKDSAVFHRWAGTVLPTTYVLDREGVVRYVGRGPLEWDAPDIVEKLDRVGAAEAAQ
jgi:thiol-disulfide isomerase/thioredoxin